MELHVYEKGTQPVQSPDAVKRARAEAIFKAFDLDGSGAQHVHAPASDAWREHS